MEEEKLQFQAEYLHDDQNENKSCCWRLISENVKREFSEIYRLSWPTIFTHLFMGTLSTQSIFFCGRIGKLELAAGTLGISFFNVFGLSIAIGLCSALDTLCSQAYGANNFKMVGVVLQRSFCILGIAVILVFAFWMTTEHFLLVIGIEEEISRMVDEFMMIMMPILPAVFGSQILIRYLSAQGIVRPTLIMGFITNIAALGLNFLFVIVLKQGFRGVAISLVIAFYCNMFLILVYLTVSKVYKKTWTGWSCECLYKWKQFVCLGLPGMLMICLEWWSFEVGAFLMGKFGESTLAAHGVLIQLVTLTFMIPYGISTAAAIRVGHNLGANKPSLAKLVMKISIGLTWNCGILWGLFTKGKMMIICGYLLEDTKTGTMESTHVCNAFRHQMFVTLLININILSAFLSPCVVLIVSILVLIVITTREHIARAFSNSGDVVEILIKVIPIMAVLSFLDATQGVCGGIVRGCGLQRIGVILNFVSYDCFGLPLAIVLAFVVGMRLAGLWWGLSGGLFIQCTLYIILLSCTNWKKQAYLAQKRTGISNQTKHLNDKEELIKPNSNVSEGKRNGDQSRNTSDISRTQVWFSRSSSLHDLDGRIVITASSDTTSASQNKTIHTHSKKRVICLRLIPLVFVLLILSVSCCVRFMVPLPMASDHNTSNSTSMGNQTFLY